MKAWNKLLDPGLIQNVLINRVKFGFFKLNKFCIKKQKSENHSKNYDVADYEDEIKEKEDPKRSF